MNQVEEVVADRNLCGEGPLWDSGRGRLLWNDCGSSLVFEYDPRTARRRVLCRGRMASGLALNDDGRMVLAGTEGIYLWSESGGEIPLALDYEGGRLVCNDVLADPAGRLYVGTYHWGPEGRERPGCLALLTPEGRMMVLDEGFELANGLALSPDASILYLADSTARVIHCYRVDRDSGRVGARRVFARISADEGIPDGLTVDAAGHLWCAQWYGGQVVRYDPDGREERRIHLPARQVSSVAFGGPDLEDLYVTSAAEAWPSLYSPSGYDVSAPDQGGSLYRIRTGLQGRAEHRARLGKGNRGAAPLAVKEGAGDRP